MAAIAKDATTIQSTMMWGQALLMRLLRKTLMPLMQWRGQRLWDVFVRRRGAWRSIVSVLTWGKSVGNNVNVLIALMLSDKVFLFIYASLFSLLIKLISELKN